MPPEKVQRYAIMPPMKRYAKAAAFLLMPAIPVLTPVGMQSGMPWLAAFAIFVGVPLLDRLTGRDDAPPVAGWRVYFYALPHCYAIVWIGSLAYGFHALSHQQFSIAATVWTFTGLGIASAFATCAAHELLHRPGRIDYNMARLIMCICAYGHFIIEHFHHHATAGHVPSGTVPLRGESVYRFVLRNVLFGWRNTWRIERARLARRNLPLWRNRVLQQYAATVAIASLVWWSWGLLALAAFVAQAVIAIFSLEMIQYFEHYGLTRSESEPIASRHSWNSNWFVTNAITFNITRHSEHHLDVSIPYQDLQMKPDCPTLPAGYFAMTWLALLPPLWYAAIDRRIPHED